MVNAAETGQDALNKKEAKPLSNRSAMELSVGSDKKDKQIRVLIIDGHEAVRRALRIRLSVPSHFEIVGVCSDPASSLDLICSERPDVVLLGLHRSSDKELAQMARSVYDMSNTATNVIVLAPFADAVERELLMNAGAKRYLLKHINSNRLIYEIESVVAGVGGD